LPRVKLHKYTARLLSTHTLDEIMKAVPGTGRRLYLDSERQILFPIIVQTLKEYLFDTLPYSTEIHFYGVSSDIEWDRVYIPVEVGMPVFFLGKSTPVVRKVGEPKCAPLYVWATPVTKYTPTWTSDEEFLQTLDTLGEDVVEDQGEKHLSYFYRPLQP